MIDADVRGFEFLLPHSITDKVRCVFRSPFAGIDVGRNLFSLIGQMNRALP